MEDIKNLDPKVVEPLMTCLLKEFAIGIGIQLEKWEFAKLAEFMETIGGQWSKPRQMFIFSTVVPVNELLGIELNLEESDGGKES